MISVSTSVGVSWVQGPSRSLPYGPSTGLSRSLRVKDGHVETCTSRETTELEGKGKKRVEDPDCREDPSGSRRSFRVHVPGRDLRVKTLNEEYTIDGPTVRRRITEG